MKIDLSTRKPIPELKDLAQAYQLCVCGLSDSAWHIKCCNKMLELITYLENTIEAPPLCVIFQHETIAFIGESESDIRVRMVSTPAWYEIIYYLPESYLPWQEIKGSTESVSEASKMVIDALHRTGLINRS